MWDCLVSEDVRLFLNKDLKEFHIHVDYNSQGLGYLLFSGPLDKGMLAGLNLRGKENDQASSYLGEMRRIY